MDLLSIEQTKGRLLIKASVLGCFLLAGALLVASLLVPPPAPSMPEKGVPPSTASVR